MKTHVTTVAFASRLLVALVCGGIAGAAIGHAYGWQYSPIAGWDTGAVVFLLWTWVNLYKCNGEDTERLSTRQDPGRAIFDTILIFASIASLAGVGELLFEIRALAGQEQIIVGFLSLGSIFISWATVHTVYCLRYARQYYRGEGGINFHSDQRPAFIDFAYLAFTIGMTFQVSDNDIHNRAIRKIILGHALLSYVFGTFIVAVTINLIAGFGR